MKKLLLKDLEIKNHTVLMRVDFNVPLNPDKTIADDTRILETLPSIQYVLKEGGKLVLMSHLGRPDGEKKTEFSLAPVAKRLEEILQIKVEMASDCIGPDVRSAIKALTPGHVLLLENLRFHKGEENPDKDPDFTKELAKNGDLFVNDAFGAAHRKHASTTLIAEFFKGKSACGLLMEKEISFLSQIILSPKHPFYAIIGGAKIGTKIGILESLLNKVDGIFIGGGMAFTFLKIQNISIGDSICDDSLLTQARIFLKRCKEKNVSVHLPIDFLIADTFSPDAHTKTINASDGVPDGWRGMDIGPKTIENWSPLLHNSSTIFWNGPMGVFEFPKFAKGTEALAKELSLLTSATTVVGGGDSVSAINNLDLQTAFSHISTGGGAVLEFIEYGHLPGIDALSDK